MNLRLQISIILIGMVLLAIILLMIQKGKLELKYSMLWISSSFMFILLAVFPDIPKWFAGMMGILDPTNAVFLVLMLFELCLNLSLTIALSKHAVKVKNLAQALALLENHEREND